MGEGGQAERLITMERGVDIGRDLSCHDAVLVYGGALVWKILPKDLRTVCCFSLPTFLLSEQ